MTSGQAPLPGRPVEVQVRRSTASAARGSASCCRTPRRSSTTSPWSRPVHTNAINHDPACTFVMTGSEVPGKASIGSWLGYGLGSESNDLPAFVVFTPRFPAGSNGQALFTRMWAQRLPADAATTASPCAARGDPVLYLQNPDGVTRRRPPDDARRARQAQPAAASSASATPRRRPASRSTRWPSACRRSVPELADLSSEPQSTSSTCTARTCSKPGIVRPQRPAGPPAGRARRARRADPAPRLGPARQPARRSSRNQCQRHRPGRPPPWCIDLKQRGLLDDTLVVWGGEFGRTVYSPGHADQRRLRPRPPPAELLHVAGRRRRQGRASSTARPTTSATTSSRTPST